MKKFYSAKLPLVFFFFSILFWSHQNMAQQSLYTGQIPIGVPLHTVSAGNVSVPIGLGYNMSGVKVNEQSGIVGVNWNLQAGGMVRRIVRDLPDDFYKNDVPSYLGASKGFYHNPVTITNENDFNYLVEDVAGPAAVKIQDKTDTESDEYFFVLPNGSSGIFYLKSDKTFVMKGSKTTKIELIDTSSPFLKTPFRDKGTGARTLIDNQNGVTEYEVDTLSKTFKGFKITTDDGNIYLFGGDVNSINYSIPFFKQYTNHWIAESWQLTKIITTDTKEINFDYGVFVDAITPVNGFSKVFGVGYQASFFETFSDAKYDYDRMNQITGSFNTVQEKSPFGTFNAVLRRPVYLNFIKSPTDSVSFFFSRSVEMLLPDKVWQKYAGYVAKSYLVDPMKYFDGGFLSGDPRTPTGSVDAFTNPQVAGLAKPKLDSIIVYGLDGKSRSQFIMNYNNTGKNMSVRGSGTYGLENSPHKGLLLKLSNMDVARSEVNNLSSVYTIPFQDRCYLQKIDIKSVDNSLLSYKFYYNNPSNLPSYFPDSSQIDHWGYYNGKKFDLNNVAGTGGYNPGGSATSYLWSNYFYSREPLNNLTQAKAGTLNMIKLPTGGFQKYEVEQNDFNYLLGPLQLSTDVGTTGIGAYRYYLPQGLTSIRLNRNTSYYVDSVNFTNNISAGLRIKEFKVLDLDSSTVLSSKKYIYKIGYSNGSTGTFSSGILDGRTDYFHHQYNGGVGVGAYFSKRESGQNEVKGYGAALYFSASAWAGGPPVTYNTVTEINSDNSYITYNFLNHYSSEGGQHLDNIRRSQPPGSIQIGLFNRFSDLSNERGNIFKTSIFNADNKLASFTKYYFEAKKDSILNASLNFNLAGYSVESRFSLSKLIFNIATLAFSGAFSFANIGKLSSNLVSNAGNGLITAGITQNIGNVLSIASSGIGLFSDPSIARYYNIQGSIYYDQIGSFQLKRVESTTYEINNPTTSLLTTKYLRYNNFFQLAADSTILPNNTWIANRYKYVSDFYGNISPFPNGSELAWQTMKARNMLSYPVEIQTIKNNKTIGASLNFYKRYPDDITNKFVKLNRTLSLKHDDLSVLASLRLDPILGFTYPINRYIITTNNLAYDASGNLTSANDRSGLTSKIEYNSFHLPVKKYIDEYRAKTETNYEYELLRGVTKVTDANAQKIHYKYDGFNRVKKVSDNDNNTILKMYDYGTLTASNPSTSTFLAEADCKINSSPCDLAAYAASDSSTITCDSTTSKIILNGWGSTDSTDVHYTWTGPNGYTSKDLNPEPIRVIGDPIDYAGKYLLTVYRDGCADPDTMSTDVNIQCSGCTKLNSKFKISGKVYPSVVSTCGIVNLSSFCDGCSTTAGSPPNLITNGDFTNGNTGFSSDFSFNNGWNLQYRSYKLDDKTNTWEWFVSCNSRPAETSGNMMIGYGGGTQRFWYQNITTIQPNTDYKFTYWAVNLGQNIDLKVTVNGVQLGASTVLSTANNDCAWKQITVTWNSGNATSATFAILNNKDSGAGNGFAIDNIALTAIPKDVKWTGPNGFVSFDKNPTKVKTPTVAGTYYYILEMKNDTCIRRFKVPVTVKACATSNCPVVCTGNTADLSISEFYSNENVLEASEATRVVVRIKNNGPNSATNVKIKFFLPFGSSCDGILSTQGSYTTQKDSKGNTIVILSPSNYIANGANDHFFISFKADTRKRFALKAEIFSATECDPNSPHGNGYTNGEDDEGLLMINDNICDNFKVTAKVNGSTIGTEQACKSTITLSTICNDCISNTGDASASSCIGDIGATGSTRKDGDIVEVFNNGTFGASNTGFSSDMTYYPGTDYQPNVFKISQTTDSYQYLPWCNHASDDRTRLPPLFVAYGGAAAGTKVWYQTVPKLLKNTDYTFSFIGTEMSSNTNIVFKLMVKSNITGSVFVDVPGTIYALDNAGCTWKKFTTVWNSGDNSSMTFALVAVSISNAYALDNFSLTYKPKVVNFNPYTWSGPNGFKAFTPTASVKLPKTPGTYPFQLIVSDGLCIDSTIVNVVVNCCDVEKPILTVSKPRICLGESVTFTATGCTGQINWSNGKLGSTFTYAPTLTDTLTARCKSLSGGCFGVNGDSLRIVVNPIPPIPGISSPRIYVCAGIPLTLTATGCGIDATAEWDNGSTGLTRSITIPGNYWAKCVDNDCKSLQKDITITAGLCCSPPTIGIAASKSTLCDYESSVTLTASNCPTGGTITWSTVTGTTVPAASKNNNPLTMNFDATSTIQASCLYNSGNCTITNTTTMTKLSVIAVPIINPANPVICNTGSVQLTAIGCADTVKWYKNDASNNKVLLSSNSLTYTATVAQTYFAECKMSTGCKSGFGSAIVGSSNCCTLPTLTVTATDRCGSGNNTLTTTGCTGGTIKWYKKNTVSNTYTDLTSSGSSYTAIGLTLGTYVYAAECENPTGCFSGKQDKTFYVKSVPDAPVIETNDSYICGIQTATISVSSGCTTGTINWSNGSTNTSLIVVGAGTYTATCTVNGCTSVVSNSILIQTGTCCTAVADPTNVITSRERCGDGSVAMSGSCGTGTVTWYDKSDGNSTNKLFEGSPYTTGSLTAKSAAYSYWVDCVTSSGCRSEKIEITVNVKPSISTAPSVSASLASICAGSSVTLTATGCTLGDATGTITWTDGSGITASNKNTNPLTVIPTVGSTYKATCTINGCTTNKSTGADVTITTVTAGITGTSTLCNGGTITLTATGGTSYSWSGPSTTTTGSVLSISPASTIYTGTYTVTATSGSCTGTSTYDVEVVTKPTINGTLTNETATICAGGSTSLEANVTPESYYSSVVYGWTKPDASTASTQSITASVAGTFTISVSGTKSGQACVTSKDIVVSTVTPSITDITVNGGYSVTGTGSTTVSLNATGCTGGTITWYYDDGEGYSVLPSPMVTPYSRTTSSSESYDATCTISGCTSSKTGLVRTLTITAIPIPVISTPSSTAFCSGSSLILNASCSDGSVTWQNVGSGLESQGNQLIINSSGTFKAKCTVGGVSGAWSNPITLNQDLTRTAPSVSASPSTRAIDGGPVVITGSNCSNGIYVLYGNGLSQSGPNSPFTRYPTETMLYQVLCVSGSGCLSNIARVDITPCTTCRTTNAQPNEK